VVNAKLVVALANARGERRQAGEPRATFHDALGDAGAASELLGSFLDGPVNPADLGALRALHRAIVPVVAALIDGSPPPLDGLNDLAARVPAAFGLKRGESEGELHAVISAKRDSAVAQLVIEVVGELAVLDPSRLRRCARPECRLVFYDATRSATQRWHAESPCGLRERQRRHRAKQPS
jgi:predicted RNA-binding Zn ribbon-like protein